MLPRVRAATRKDIPEILRLNALLSDFHVRIDPYYKSGEETSGGFKLVLENLFDDEKTNILVADKGNGLAGYFIGMIQPPKPFLRPEKTGRISDAFVEQAFRGRGLGEKKCSTGWSNGLKKTVSATSNYRWTLEIRKAQAHGESTVLRIL